MKKSTILFLLAFLMFSCQQTTISETSAEDTASTEATVKDGVFIHITESYNDPHKVLMPLKMATIMANDKDVLVYMDIHTVELLVKGAEDLNMEGFESFQTYISKLVEMGVGLYACPTCLKIAGYQPEDLMDGVQTAQKDKFFNFTEGKIISLDY